MVIKQTISCREQVNFHRKTYNKMFVLFSNFFLIKFKEKYLYVYLANLAPVKTSFETKAMILTKQNPREES